MVGQESGSGSHRQSRLPEQEESRIFRIVLLQTPNLQLISSETPMYRAFAGSWRLSEPPTGLAPFIHRGLRDF